MRHSIRQGMGRGRGSGYKNLIKGHDTRVHHDSGHGIKQPQRVMLGACGDAMPALRQGWKIAKAKEPDVNEIAANELYLYTENDSELYRQMRQPIQKNLLKKLDKGTYDSEKALKAFENLTYKSARKYRQEFGSHNQKIFSKADRREAAKLLRQSFESDYNIVRKP